MVKNVKINWFLLIISVFAVEIIGSLSALFAGNIKQIYNELQLPVLSPPDYLFGIVWPILYALIGISGYLIYQASDSSDRVINLTLFIGQLFINFIWSILFFKFAAYWLGFMVIIILDILVLICIIKFFKSIPLSAYLFVPYFVWLLFATYLTLAVAILN